MEAIKHIDTAAIDIYTYDHPLNRSEILMLTPKEKILMDQVFDEISHQLYTTSDIVRIWEIFLELSICNIDEKECCEDPKPSLKLTSRVSILGKLFELILEVSLDSNMENFLTILHADLIKCILDKSKYSNFI